MRKQYYRSFETNIFRLLSGIAFLILISCEERIDISLKSEKSDLLVVESVLTNDKTNQLVKLSYPYQESNGTSLPISGASVIITDGNNVFALSERPAGSGLYLTDSLIAVVGRVYTLTIQFQGKQYFAQDSAVPVEPVSALRYIPASDSLYYTLVTGPEGTGANYIQYQINWENTAMCQSPGSCAGEIIFYDLKTIDVNEIFKPSKVEFDFPVGATIIRKKYSVSPDYGTFLRGVLSETEWRGGIFDVERANAPTNLSEGAIGFFAVSTVLSDTTVVQ